MKNNIFDKNDIKYLFGTDELPDELPLYYYLIHKKKLGDVLHIRFEESQALQGEICVSPFWKPISKSYILNEK